MRNSYFSRAPLQLGFSKQETYLFLGMMAKKDVAIARLIDVGDANAWSPVERFYAICLLSSKIHRHNESIEKKVDDQKRVWEVLKTNIGVLTREEMAEIMIGCVALEIYSQLLKAWINHSY